MSADDIIKNLYKHKFQAKQLSANSIVVSIVSAEKLIRHAYREGYNQGFKKSKE